MPAGQISGDSLFPSRDIPARKSNSSSGFLEGAQCVCRYRFLACGQGGLPALKEFSCKQEQEFQRRKENFKLKKYQETNSVAPATTFEEADSWETTLGLAEELAFEFDEEKYQKAKALFDVGLKLFAADTPEESMRGLVRYYATKMTREALAKMKPYAIRYIEELSAQQQTQTRQLSPTAQCQDLLAKFAEASEDQPTEVQCLADFADLTVEDGSTRKTRSGKGPGNLQAGKPGAGSEPTTSGGPSTLGTTEHLADGLVSDCRLRSRDRKRVVEINDV
jgi:hypothetical protein